MVIIAEHELIRTEERFALMQGIPVEDLSKEKKIVANDTHVTSDIFQRKIKQWRLMFYFDIMRDFPLKKLIDEYKPKNELYIQMNLGNNITKFLLNYEPLLKEEVNKQKYRSAFKTPRAKLQNIRNNSCDVKLAYKSSFVDSIVDKYKKSISRQNKSKSVSKRKTPKFKLESIDESDTVNLKCNKMRIHYFFTEDYDIQQFINDTSIEIRITDGGEWKDTIAKGTLGLHLVNKDMKNDPAFNYDMASAHIPMLETVNVYMFCLAKDIEPFYLKTKVGYKFDQEILTRNLDLWKYNSVYFPDNGYFNSNALPIEWLEMFEKKEKLG